MKYMVGYQLRQETDLIDTIISNKESIYGVYFSWGDMPNGRSNLNEQQGFLPWQAQQQQIADLKRVSRAGIPLNILFNANCYGAKSLSKNLFEQIGDVIEYIINDFGLKSVTTTSPVIAKFIRANFETLEIIASVNMNIGSIKGMEYIKTYFDSFYMQREYNRDIQKIRLLSHWCSDNGKKLYILANSGCLNNCTTHNFHDNLVAHEAQIRTMDNAYTFKGLCWEYLENQAHYASVLRDTSFVRPEDIHIYDEWFEAAKLATRTSSFPVQIIEAYIKQSYRGSILNLLEPNHSGAILPYILENKKIDPKFIQTVLHCKKRCDKCGYCQEVFEQACMNLI